MHSYIALIRKAKGTSYGVEFPDFPGLVSGGETLADALRLAQEALAFHIEGLGEDGEPIPEPSLLDRIVADPENRDAVAVMVPGPIQRGKAMRVNLTFEEGLLTRIDEAAAADGIGRSGWLAMLARQRLETTSGYPTGVVESRPRWVAGTVKTISRKPARPPVVAGGPKSGRAITNKSRVDRDGKSRKAPGRTARAGRGDNSKTKTKTK